MRRLRAALGAAAILSLLAVWPAAAASPPTVASGPDPFAGCTADQPALQQAGGSVLYPGSEIEPRSAVDPTNPRHLVAEYQQDRWSDGGARGLTAAYSFDGGQTWGLVPMTGITRCSGGRYDRASDPWVSFAPDGTVHAIALAFDWFDWHNAIIASRSTDGGRTWSDPIEITADDTAGLDKESITADPHDANLVYATWDRVIGPGGSTHAADTAIFRASSYKSQTFFSKSVDGGRSWSVPSRIFTTASYSGSIGGMIRVLSDGTLIDGLATYGSGSWKGGACASIAVIRSSDGGTSWSQKPALVAPFSCTYAGATDPDTGAPVRSGGLPDVAVSGMNVYAVWEDGTPAAPTVGRIWFSQSTDGGVQWSAPTVVSKTEGAVSAFVPTVAVNDAGTVGISYYDFRDNTASDGIGATDAWLIRCAAGCTSAAAWSEVRLTPTSFDIHVAPFARGEFLGDYQGLTTSGAAFQPFFIGAVSQADPTDAFVTTVP